MIKYEIRVKNLKNKRKWILMDKYQKRVKNLKNKKGNKQKRELKRLKN